jgi:hypothetical protein
MPIHDQSYRRYAGGRALPGRAWTVIAWSGILGMLRKRAFLGLLLFAWLPFVVRAVQIYVATNFPAGGDARARRADVPRLPRPAGILRLHHHDLRRRRPHRDRPPGQRAADLPLEAADARRVHRRQGGHAVRLPA